MNNAYDLFREEAVKHQFRRLIGKVYLLNKRAVLGISSLALFLLFGMSMMFYFVQIPLTSKSVAVSSLSSFDLIVEEYLNAEYEQVIVRTNIGTYDFKIPIEENKREKFKNSLLGSREVFFTKQISLAKAILSHNVRD